MKNISWRASRKFLSIRRDFYLDLALALEEGESELIYLRQRESSYRKSGNRLAEAYSLLASRVQRGSSISVSLSGLIPDTELAVLDVYHQESNLPDGLRIVANTVEKVAEAKEILRGTIFNPIIALVVIISMLVAIHISITPVLLTLVKDRSKWLLIGQLVAGAGDAIVAYWWLIGSLAISFIYFSARQFSRWSGSTRAKYDNYPLFSMYRDFVSAQVLGALASLLKANVPIQVATETLAKRSSPWARWHLIQISAHLKRYPTDIEGAFSKGFVGKQTASRLGDLMRRADVVSSLQRIGSESVNALIPRTRNMAKNLELVLYFVIGFAMLVVQGGMAWTMQDAGDQISQSLYQVTK